MTGRELIIYILENNLEDESIFTNSKVLGFITTDEAALKYNVGPETIKTWFALNRISGINIENQLCIPDNVNKEEIKV